MPEDGRGISRNVASLNILVNDVINLSNYDWEISLPKSEKVCKQCQRKNNESLRNKNRQQYTQKLQTK